MLTPKITVVRRLICSVIICAPGLLDGETLTLREAIQDAEANNRAIRAGELERSRAQEEVNVARTYRLPVFSLIALGSQSLAHLGLTFPQGSLGVYPNIGPVPGETTTLAGPLQPGGIFYGSVAQPLSQQHKIGLAIQLARVGVDIADEGIRSKRHSTINEAAAFTTESCKARAPREVCWQPSNFCGSSTRIWAATWSSGWRCRPIFSM